MTGKIGPGYQIVDTVINMADYTSASSGGWYRVSIPANTLFPNKTVHFAETIYWINTGSPMITILDGQGSAIYIVSGIRVDTGTVGIRALVS